MLAITVARLAFAAAIPLTEDEAYYRLWGASPQFGYYDHPPMIAWWIRAGVTLAGDNALGVRLLPALSSGLTSLVVYDLTRRLGASRDVGVRAAVWFNATFLIAAGGFLATPDAAAAPFWTLSLWCLARTAGPDAKAGRWWIGAGAAAGLACLSKYSALFLAPGVLVWLLSRRGGRRALRRPWPWIAAVVAGLIFSCNVAWNATHHWASFEKQFGRVAPGRFAPQYLLELITGQILLLNPAIAWFLGARLAEAAFVRRDRVRAEPDPAAGSGMGLLLATSAPFVLYLGLHSLHDRVQAHWPAPLYPALAILAADSAERISKTGFQAVLKRIAAPLSFGLSALALLHLALPASDLKGLRDPTAQLRGWPAFAYDVEAVRKGYRAGWVGTVSYGTTGQLAAQPAIKAPTAELIERDRFPPGDRSWRADLTRPGLVIDLDRRLSVKALSLCFGQVTPMGVLPRGEPGYNPANYAAFLVSSPTHDVLHEGCWPSHGD